MHIYKEYIHNQDYIHMYMIYTEEWICTHHEEYVYIYREYIHNTEYDDTYIYIYI